MSVATDLKKEILSITNLCNDTTGIIIELLYIDTKPVLERLMLDILTQSDNVRDQSDYFKYKLRTASSIQEYITLNENYLIEQINKEENIKLIHNFITKYKECKKLHDSSLLYVSKYKKCKKLYNPHDDDFDVDDDAFDDEEYFDLQERIFDIFAQIHPILDDPRLYIDNIKNNIIKWILKTFDNESV